MSKISSKGSGNAVALTSGEKMSLDEKYAFLESLGREDLVNVFKDYKNRKVKSRPKTAPLDQRVAISITPLERVRLTKEIREIEKNSGKMSISQYIRNKATRSIDIQEWREIAEKELDAIADIEKNKNSIRKERREIISRMAEGDFDDEEIFIKERDIVEIDKKLSKLIAKGERRSNRLNGRMTMPEAELVRWRAEQLFLTVSDYLRIMLFDLTPASAGDAHLGLDARKRFYASIIRVSLDGWGSPPNVYECSQCPHYVEEIRVLQDRVNQLETFV